MLSKSLLGQNDVKNELRMIRDVYTKTNYFSFDVEAYSYNYKSDKIPKLLGKGSAKKGIDCYYSNFGGYEYVLNGKQTLIIDNNNKSITIYDIDAKVKSEMDINFDSLALFADSISFDRSSNGQKHFVFYTTKGYVNKTEIFADPSNNFVTKILYHYVSSNQEFEIGFDRVEVNYKNIKTNEITKSFFLFENYINKEKSTIKPVGKYRSYNVKYFNPKK